MRVIDCLALFVALDSELLLILKPGEFVMLTHNQLTLFNHLFFASLFVLCLAWQESLSPWTGMYSLGQTAKALHVPPRSPPPVFDPEVTDSNLDSFESNAYEAQPTGFFD